MKVPVTISYSALTDYKDCPRYYKLKRIDKLKPFEGTVWTHFGTLIHKYLQSVLANEIGGEEAAKKMKRTWLRYCRLYKKNIIKEHGTEAKNIIGIYIPARKSIETVVDIFEKKFGKFKVLSIEEKLYTPSSTKHPQTFVGYIDLVIKTADGKIIIIDFKTCSSGFMFGKYQDKYKDYQLSLYKNFYQIVHSIDPKSIETYFVTIERAIKSKKPLKMVRVTSGPKKLRNALEWLDNVLDGVNRRVFVKKKTNCYKYGEKYPCFFCGTGHCK